MDVKILLIFVVANFALASPLDDGENLVRNKRGMMAGLIQKIKGIGSGGSGDDSTGGGGGRLMNLLRNGLGKSRGGKSNGGGGGGGGGNGSGGSGSGGGSGRGSRTNSAQSNK